MNKTNSYSSPYFEIIELAEGIYAATPAKGSILFSNAGIVDLGDRTLIFDTFDALQGGADLLEASVALTGKSPSLVILSHSHADHWAGNQAFGSIPILSTAATRLKMEDETLPDPRQLEEQIRDLEERLKVETDPRWRAGLEPSVTRRRLQVQNATSARKVMPDQTFDGEMVFYGAQRRAVLSHRGHAHSPGDAILFLPQDSIAFIGDLGFFQEQPYMGACLPQAWREQLAWLAGSNYEVFIPGHGPVGNKGNLRQMDRYIAWMSDHIRRAQAKGRTPEEVIALGLPAPFDAWLMGGMGRFENNVRALMNLPTPS